MPNAVETLFWHSICQFLVKEDVSIAINMTGGMNSSLMQDGPENDDTSDGW